MEKEADFRDYANIIIKRRKTIIIGVLVITIFSGILSYLLPKSYQASMFIDLARIYVSSKLVKEQIQYIEDPGAIAKLIKSDGFLDEIRKEIDPNISLNHFRDQVEAEIFLERYMNLPLVKVDFQGRDQHEVVNILDLIGEKVIERTNIKYKVFIDMLEKTIANNEEKIAIIRNIISIKKKYKNITQNHVDKGKIDIDKVSEDLSGLTSSGVSPIELLFLQSSSDTQRQFVVSLKQYIEKLETGIADSQTEIAGLKDQIITIKARIKLSTPPGIYSKAVLPAEPISPKKRVIVGVALFGSLICTSLLVIIQETLRKQL